MSQFSQEQISQFMDDIGFLRKSIQKNTPIIQQIAMNKSLRLTSFFTGVSIITLSIISLLLQKQYGSFSNSPTWMKIIFVGLIILSLIVGSVLKSTGILREARQLHPRITFWKVASQIYSQRFIHLQVSTVLLTSAFIYHAVIKGNTWAWIPIISGFLGLNFLLYYIFFRIASFVYVGYWFIVTSILLSFYQSVTPQIGCIITFGAGMILFALLSYLPENKTVTVKE